MWRFRPRINETWEESVAGSSELVLFYCAHKQKNVSKLLNRTGKWIYALTSCLNKTGNLGKFEWWKLVHDLLNCLSGTRSSWMMPPLLKQTAFKGTWTTGMTYKVFCVCVSKVLFVVLSSQTIPDFTLYLWSYGVMTMTWWSLATSVCQSCG